MDTASWASLWLWLVLLGSYYAGTIISAKQLVTLDPWPLTVLQLLALSPVEGLLAILLYSVDVYLLQKLFKGSLSFREVFNLLLWSHIPLFLVSGYPFLRTLLMGVFLSNEKPGLSYLLEALLTRSISPGLLTISLVELTVLLFAGACSVVIYLVLYKRLGFGLWKSVSFFTLLFFVQKLFSDELGSNLLGFIHDWVTQAPWIGLIELAILFNLLLWYICRHLAPEAKQSYDLAT